MKIEVGKQYRIVKDLPDWHGDVIIRAGRRIEITGIVGYGIDLQVVRFIVHWLRDWREEKKWEFEITMEKFEKYVEEIELKDKGIKKLRLMSSVDEDGIVGYTAIQTNKINEIIDHLNKQDSDK